MGSFKSFLSIFLLLICSLNLHAQDHVNAWMRATLRIPVKERFKVDGEFQHRRQNGLNNHNLFDKNLVFSFKNWVHYQHNPGIQFSVSPFAYYSNYKIINTDADVHANPTSEIRFSAAMELKHKLGSKLDVIGRSALEYRIFDKNPKEVLRFRNRLGLQYEFNNQWKAVTSMEILVNLSGVAATYFLDHNRYGVNLEYQPTKNIKLELGYLYISRLTKTNIQKTGENTLFLNITYQLNKQRKE